VPSRILLWSITSALAGFLFGFDTVVISGAEQRIQQLWGLSAALHGVAMASALYGTVVGALVGGWPTDRLGRRATLLGIGVLYLVGAIWSALATDVVSFIAARVLGGLGIGLSTVAAPLYIAEIAPPARRGLLTGMFQFNIVFGILMAFLSNALLADTGAESWRWMLGVAAVPSLLYAVACLFIPESPRWLLTQRNDRARGVAVLRLIDPEATTAQLDARADEIVAHARTTIGSERFFTAALRTPILLAFLVAFFNQLSGINAILYFAPRIFALTGLGDRAALLTSVGIGVTNLVFTFVGLQLIDWLGRRTLLYVGSAGYIASLGLASWAFATQRHALVPACIFGFIAAHAVGQGTVIWVLISEVFPTQHRAAGQALGSSTHWVFAALLTTFFPSMVTAFSPSTVFAFFCGMMMVHLLWVWRMVPETRGRSLEAIQDQLTAA
jgi:sugar porter (SP) family MFS transporter